MKRINFAVVAWHIGATSETPVLLEGFQTKNEAIICILEHREACPDCGLVYYIHTFDENGDVIAYQLIP